MSNPATTILLLSLAAIVTIACAPGEVERTVSSPYQTCTLKACLPQTVCGPVVDGKQSCQQYVINDCNTCSSPTTTVCVPQESVDQGSSAGTFIGPGVLNVR